MPNKNPLLLLARNDYSLIKKLYLNPDAIDNAWNHWVLDYNQKRQMEFLSGLAGSKLSWEDLAIAMIVTVGIVKLTLTCFLLRENPAKIEPLQRIYVIFLHKLKRKGMTRQPHEGPVDFSKRAIKQLPGKTDEIRKITDIYTQMRYRNRQNAESIQLLKSLVNAFK